MTYFLVIILIYLPRLNNTTDILYMIEIKQILIFIDLKIRRPLKIFFKISPYFLPY